MAARNRLLRLEALKKRSAAASRNKRAERMVRPKTGLSAAAEPLWSRPSPLTDSRSAALPASPNAAKSDPCRIRFASRLMPWGRPWRGGGHSGRRPFAQRGIPTSNICCSATAPQSSRARCACRGSKPSPGSSTPRWRSAWTTSRARRCATGAGSRRCGSPIDAVKKGEADVAVSAGNTGALMAMAKFNLRRCRASSGRRSRRCGRRSRRIVVLDVGASIGADAAASGRSRGHGQRDGARAVRYRAADRRPAEYRRRGGQRAGGGARGRPDPARRPIAAFRLSRLRRGRRYRQGHGRRGRHRRFCRQYRAEDRRRHGPADRATICALQ